MTDIYVGRVIAVHQNDNSMDIQLSYDGSMLTGVPLIGPMMTTSSGVVNMHHTEGNAQDGAGSKTRDSQVIVARTSGGYIALGFLSPQVNQMNFDRQNFKIDRHASDVYHTIDNSGNMELSHPSGTFVRVATSPDHEDLAGQDADSLWGITRNKSAAVWLSVVVANEGGVKAEIKIDPDGNISLVNKGNLTVTTTGDASVSAASATIVASGSATISAESVTINASTSTHNGNVVINGNLSISGAITNKNVGIGSGHIHSGVTTGDEQTGTPSS